MVIYIEWKGVGVHPPSSPARADFSIMMGFTPEIGNCRSVCTLWWGTGNIYISWRTYFYHGYLYNCHFQRSMQKCLLILGLCCSCLVHSAPPTSKYKKPLFLVTLFPVVNLVFIYSPPPPSFSSPKEASCNIKHFSVSGLLKSLCTAVWSTPQSA